MEVKPAVQIPYRRTVAGFSKFASIVYAGLGLLETFSPGNITSVILPKAETFGSPGAVRELF